MLFIIVYLIIGCVLTIIVEHYNRKATSKELAPEVLIISVLGWPYFLFMWLFFSKRN